MFRDSLWDHVRIIDTFVGSCDSRPHQATSVSLEGGRAFIFAASFVFTSVSTTGFDPLSDIIALFLTYDFDKDKYFQLGFDMRRIRVRQ